MRVSCGNARTRPSAATRSSCAPVRPEKKRAWPRTRAASTGFSLFSTNLSELRELVFLPEPGVLGSGVAAGANVVAVIAQSLLDDRHQVGVDLRVPRRVLLVQVEQVRSDDVHAVRPVAGAQRNHWDRQRRGQVLADLRGGHLAHDREAAGVDHRPGVVDQLLGALGGLALREKPAQLRHAHRRDADMALHRDAGLDDRLDILRVVPVALAFHHLGAALRDVLGGVLDRLHRREVEAHVGHVDHAQAVLRAALDRLGHEHHLLERHRGRVLVAEQHHAAGVGDAQDVDADAVRDDRSLVVVDRELHDRLALFHLLHQRRDRDFLARRLLRDGLGLGHVSPPLGNAWIARLPSECKCFTKKLCQRETSLRVRLRPHCRRHLRRVAAGAHAAPVKALRSIARSSIGMHSAAAMTDSAIAASHTGRYEPVRSNTAPPAQAPMNAPSWWPRNAIENSVERYFTPKIWPTRELVSGTVASQVTPSTAAKRYAPAAETGVEMNSAITSARTA